VVSGCWLCGVKSVDVLGRAGERLPAVRPASLMGTAAKSFRFAVPVQHIKPLLKPEFFNRVRFVSITFLR